MSVILFAGLLALTVPGALEALAFTWRYFTRRVRWC